ncbi:CAP domain-containing protein [Actinotalea solisilvae]|uniref:CAP domain-containing protein n=1 Tax=Actinotalea solisilvae TaxID=2072922 RepID=UPI0018F174AC|nr:CAP domain-containing protein [Actinotalea solisilvae]
MTTQLTIRQARWRAARLALPLFGGLVAGCAAQGDDHLNVDRVPATLEVLTADARRGAGSPPIAISTCAAEAALARAEALVGRPELTHAPLDDVIAGCGVTTAAENLSRAPTGTPAQDVVDAWMESPGHRANILDPDLTQVGVGCAEDGDDLVCSMVLLGPTSRPEDT